MRSPWQALLHRAPARSGWQSLQVASAWSACIACCIDTHAEPARHRHVASDLNPPPGFGHQCWSQKLLFEQSNGDQCQEVGQLGLMHDIN